jgi:hypothetical protein
LVSDRLAVEQAYIDELVRLLSRGADHLRNLHYVTCEVEAEFPETTVVVFFRVPNDSDCLYGTRDAIWSEGGYDSPAEARQWAGYTWDRIYEMANADPKLPRSCQPDDAGVTWVDLWPD